MPGSEENAPGALSLESLKQSTSPPFPISSFDVFSNEDAQLSAFSGLDYASWNRPPDSSLNLFQNTGLNSANNHYSLVAGAAPTESALSGLPPVQETPDLIRHSMEYIFRILRTWPRMVAKGVQLPPIIHPLQGPSPDGSKRLSNCFAVARMWYGQLPGTRELVQDTARGEIREILSSVRDLGSDLTPSLCRC
jgi:hypothetical protein